MASSTPPIIPIFVAFLLVASSLSPVLSLPNVSESGHRPPANQTFRPGQELQRWKRVHAYLRKINKPSSPDGDVIDCVLSHLQPAFDHPQLRGQKPLDPPERPKGHDSMDTVTESFQPWTSSGVSCPEGTIPIRRTTEKDILRASSMKRFGRKLKKNVRRDSTSSNHEHAVVFVNGDQYYGAKASINVWAPHVADEYEFSLSQIWVISGSFGDDLNTIEAGWQACNVFILFQVSPELYGDNYPRFFTYWTTDAYQATGCYNLLCSGFVQTNNKIAIGAAISPRSSYRGRQFDIGLMVWKDLTLQHKWAAGHFAEEGFGKASYFRNLQVVDWDNSLLPLSNLHLLADHSNCYDIREGKNNAWGNYFYYGGPGRNVRCP
ncbi:hypothetical protein L1049_028509 [Liquidambar formosana]|uniref:Neprosin PEP catalytic domain-containing protein n=1 Tax=Liquidambar formosana TaxID=63359 RepID=A0AAP0RKB2_LIQFO